LLIDDLADRRYAIDRGLSITGTLGALRDASRQGLIDLRQALNQLAHTTFRATPELMQQMLDEAADSGPDKP
jgi:predicted nucleic acid-binding protein